MSVLANSDNVNINHLNNTTVGGNAYYNNTAIGGNADLNSWLDPIPDASFARNKTTSPPDSECLPGTREGVIEEITLWADKTIFSASSHVYWLYGYAGCGKSSISQAVAERFRKKGRLVASFFFFRSSDRRSGFKSVPATLASQLAAAIPATAPLILASLKAEAGLLSSMSIGAQMEHLVYKPFETAVKGEFIGSGVIAMLRKPFLIIIDGLDECEDKEAVEQFIDHMLSFFETNPSLPLRFFITSRVEEHIRTRLNTDKVRLDNLANHCPHEDIIAFIHAKFALAARLNRIVRAYGPKWPSQKDVQGLARLSNGSFIFISMLLKYIFETADDGLNPMQRLPRALEMRSNLDGLYASTLRRSEHLPHFSSIISTLTYLRISLPTSSIAKLLNIELYEVIAVLLNLQAIIQLPGDDITPVTLCHSSLQDFLTAESRSGPFFSQPITHENMAYRCLDLLIRHRPNLLAWDQSGLAYASWYSCTHLELASKALDYDQHYYNRIITYMNQQFPTLFPLVLSISLRIEGIGYHDLFKLLDELLKPKVPALDLRLIAKVIAALSHNANGHRVLNSCSTQLRSLLVPDVTHYTSLAKQCVRYLVCPWGFEWDNGRTFGRFPIEYVLVYWAKHIELAVLHDPAMDPKVFQEHFVLSPVYGLLGWSSGSGPLNTHQIQENVARAVEAIQNKFPGTVVSNPDKLVTFPTTPDEGCVVEVHGPLSILTLLDAFQQVDPTQTTRLTFMRERTTLTISLHSNGMYNTFAHTRSYLRDTSWTGQRGWGTSLNDG